MGRPSIPPEKLLCALLLQAFYSVRAERQLMKQLNDNLPFRWFVGLSVDQPVWDAGTFSKNRDRLPARDIATAFMDAVLNVFEAKRPLSADRAGRPVITLASGSRMFLACGATDMRKGMTGLAMLVQQSLAEDPLRGAVSPSAAAAPG